jgi:hypothetical protein
LAPSGKNFRFAVRFGSLSQLEAAQWGIDHEAQVLAAYCYLRDSVRVGGMRGIQLDERSGP